MPRVLSPQKGRSPGAGTAKAPSLFFCKKTGLRRRPYPVSPPGCDCNLQNRRTVSHILAGTKQHAPGSRSNILPGSAPALHSVILYPFSPLPLPLRTTPSPSPRTLARNPHPAPVESTFAPKPARTLPFPAHSEAKRIAHHGTGFPPRRPVPGAVTGFGMQAGDTSPWA